MSLSFDFVNSEIQVLNPQTTVDVQTLVNSIRAAEDSVIGQAYPSIANITGKQSLGGGVLVGITCELINWQLKPWAGNYVMTISGGNLVGGKSGVAVAYVAGVQVSNILSANATIAATGGSALTAQEHDRLFAVPTLTEMNASPIPVDVKMTNGVVIKGTGVTADKFRGIGQP